MRYPEESVYEMFYPFIERIQQIHNGDFNENKKSLIQDLNEVASDQSSFIEKYGFTDIDTVYTNGKETFILLFCFNVLKDLIPQVHSLR